MKVKEMIRELKKYNENMEVQIEIAIFDAMLHSREDRFVITPARMRDPEENPILIIGGYAGEDGRKK